MTREVKEVVGRPDNSAFIRRCIFYAVILAVMLFFAPSIFEAIMEPMAASGMTVAWYTVFVPITLFMMAIGLFRSWRRRWPLAYMNEYIAMARECDYEFCPRCGSPLVLKMRTRYNRQKVGERIKTTTYSDGSQTVNREDVYGNVASKSYYHECTNSLCKLEPEQNIGQSHLPWKKKEIECLVLNDDSLLGRKHPSARSILLSRLLVPFLAIVIIIASAVIIYGYADTHTSEWTYTTADREPERSAYDYRSYLLSLDTENHNWYVTHEREPSDMMSYLGNMVGIDKTVGYTIGGHVGNGFSALSYRFEGDDAGTGIPYGWYTLTQLDGVNVLIDDTNEKIYKEGTEFYDTYAPKLVTLTHDKDLEAVFERLDGGEHALCGSNDFWMEFIRKDNTMLFSYLQSDDISKIIGEFRAITTYPDENMMEKWYFSYDDHEYVPDSLEGYVYSDAAPEEQDELGKLIEASNEGDGDYTLYRGDAEVLDISIDYLVNGYEFFISEATDDLGLGLAEDDTYRININAKTLTKITIDENYREVMIEMPLSEHQATYDFLLGTVPDLYIRRIIDMDKAEVKDENLGLSKSYAEMKVALGKIGEVIHYTAEGEYVKIELSY